jgi:hypothetical protein
MYLIAAVEPFRKQGPRQESTLHVLSYFCLMLHKCVTLFNRIQIKMKILLINMLNCLFFAIDILYTLDSASNYSVIQQLKLL